MHKKSPLAIVTMGDPAGIGPEIICKTISQEKNIPVIVVGSEKVLKKTFDQLNLCVDWIGIRSLDELPDKVTKPIIWDMDNVNIDTWTPGKIDGEYGRAAFEYIEKSVELAQKNSPLRRSHCSHT